MNFNLKKKDFSDWLVPLMAISKISFPQDYNDTLIVCCWWKIAQMHMHHGAR